MKWIRFRRKRQRESKLEAIISRSVFGRRYLSCDSAYFEKPLNFGLAVTPIFQPSHPPRLILRTCASVTTCRTREIQLDSRQPSHAFVCVCVCVRVRVHWHTFSRFSFPMVSAATWTIFCSSLNLLIFSIEWNIPRLSFCENVRTRVRCRHCERVGTSIPFGIEIPFDIYESPVSRRKRAAANACAPFFLNPANNANEKCECNNWRDTHRVLVIFILIRIGKSIFIAVNIRVCVCANTMRLLYTNIAHYWT